MGDCYKFAVGKKDEAKAYGAFSFLNGPDGVWLRRDSDGKNPKQARENARRSSTRTRAVADAGVGDGVPARNAMYPQPVIQPPAPPLMPRPRLGASRPGGMAGVGLRGPLAEREPEPNCNGLEDFVALALVIALAFIGLKIFRRSQRPKGMQEPLMDA